MLERVGSAAQKVATSVSRRSFFTRLGQGAMGLAGVIGAMSITAGKAQAALHTCVYCGGGAICGTRTVHTCHHCPPSIVTPTGVTCPLCSCH
jgi:hypothetical protein